MKRTSLKPSVLKWLLVLLAAAIVAGCASTPTAAPTDPPDPAPAPTDTSEPEEEEEADEEAAAAALIEFENQLEDFDPADFSNPTQIDNPWYSMPVGAQWVFDGSVEESGLTIPHQIIFTITDLTKEIEGVNTVVAWVEDFSEGQLVEAELAFYAQDDSGRVWYFGEYPEEYEDGQFVDAPAWIAGRKGARAGLKMQADPQEGMPRYSQGWGPAVNWTDYGQIDQTGLEVCVPVDCYQDVLMIAESSLGEKDAYQLKYYAKGVGEIQVGWRGEDATKETLELIEFNQLDPEALAMVREHALALEESAYKRSKEVYGSTPPLEPISP